MQRARLLGLALMAVFAFSVVAAASASAAETEAGLLYLAGESGQVTFEGTGGTGTLKTPAGTITCEKTKAVGHSTQTEKHITTGLETITFNGCKQTKEATKVACRTEGSEKVEEIVTPGTFTLFNALDRATKTVLEPGIGVTVVNAADEPTTLKLKCGAVAIVEVKGTVLGLVTEAVLTADVTSANLHFVNEGELCDTENAFCKKSQEKANELLAKFGASFEKAEEQTDVKVTFNKMVLIDD